MSEKTVLTDALRKRNQLIGKTRDGEILDLNGLARLENPGTCRKKLGALNPIEVITGPEPVVGYKSNTDFNRDTKAYWDSLMDSVKNSEELYAGILKANADTKIIVCKKEVTIAHAIVMRSVLIPRKKEILKVLKEKFASATMSFNRKMELAKNSAANQLTTIGEMKADSPQYKELYDKIFEANKPTFLDPLGLKKKIEALEEEIEEAEADLRTGIFNANHTAMVEWEACK